MYLLPRFARVCSTTTFRFFLPWKNSKLVPSSFPSRNDGRDIFLAIFGQNGNGRNREEHENLGREGGEGGEFSREVGFFRDLGGLSPFSYERCLELLLLASPYVALLRTPRTGSLGRSRKKGEGCVWKIGAT